MGKWYLHASFFLGNKDMFKNYKRFDFWHVQTADIGGTKPWKNNCSLIWKLSKFLMTLLAGLFEMRGCWHIGLRWEIIALWATCFSVNMNSIFIKLTDNVGLFRVPARSDLSLWRNMPLSGEKNVSSFSHSPLIRYLANLQVREHVKARMSSKLGRIGLLPVFKNAGKIFILIVSCVNELTEHKGSACSIKIATMLIRS